MFVPNVGQIEPIDGGNFRVVVDSIDIGDMYIEDIRKAMTAYGTDIKFVQKSKRGGQPFTGNIGRAYRSKSGRALNLKIDGQLYTVSMATFQMMLDGHYTAVGISRYEDEQQAPPVAISF